MRRKLLFFFLILYIPGFAQSDHLPFGASNLHNRKSNIEFNADITAGYVIKDSNQAFKANLCIHDILFHRLGAYTSIETGSDFFYNMYGGTITIHPRVYLFAGVGIFGDGNQLLSGREISPRKELGIGIIPYRSLVIRVGYSGSAGPTVAAGFKFPMRL